MIIKESHAIIIERLGKFHRVKKAGWTFLVPFLDNIKLLEGWGTDANKEGKYIELSEQQIDTNPRICYTKDNVQIYADAIVYWRIINPKKAVYEVDRLPQAIQDVPINALRSVIGTMTLDEVFQNRQMMTERISAELKETAEKWGVIITRVEIKELDVKDKNSMNAMKQEMEAERRKRAKVLDAESESSYKETLANAEAKAMNIIAGAEADYLEILSKKVGKKHAAQILITNKVLDGFKIITTNPAHKVFLPNSVMSSLVHGLDENKSNNLSPDKIVNENLLQDGED